MITAFVGGATGFTGREVVRLLAENGHRVVAHVRPDSPSLSEWWERFGAMGAEIDTTPWEKDALAMTMSRINPDVVFGLLGTTRDRNKLETEKAGVVVDYQTVDYGLTVMLLHAAEKAVSKPRFVLLSASGVSEKPSSPYYKAKYMAEKEVRAGLLPWIIARPSFIGGEGRDEKRPFEKAGIVMVDNALKVAGLFGGKKLSERYRSTTNKILAASLIKLSLESKAAGKVYESEDLRIITESPASMAGESMKP